MGEPTGDAVDGSVTRLSFSFSAPGYPLVDLSAASDWTVYLEKMIPRSGDTYAAFFRVTGRDLDGVCEAFVGYGAYEGYLLEQRRRTALLEFEVCEEYPAAFLAEAGSLPRRIEAGDEEARIVAEVPPRRDAGAIAQRFLDAYSNARLVSKYADRSGTPLLATLDPMVDVADRLTDRQREVVATAHEAGYYDWPRAVTAEDLAERRDVAPATLHKHLRAAERKLVTAFFEATGSARECARN